jgi:hypothetical protein
MLVNVFNLATGRAAVYVGISPSGAVVAAHAQDRGDWSVWDYRKKYARGLVINKITVRCGDWTAKK